MKQRHRLFAKYAALIVALVAGALIVSGALSLYFGYGENKQALFALQREKADAAAYRIEQYVKTIEHEIGWTALPRVLDGASATEMRRIEFLKLLRQAPQITEAVWIDRAGVEQVRVSRLAMDSLATGGNLAVDLRVAATADGRTYFGPVTFRKDTEPYMAIARAAGGQEGGTTAVEVNLKFVWDVVSQMRIGKAGVAYVVDAQNHLVAHPDISLVLQKLAWAQLAQVKAARAGPAAEGPEDANARQVEAKNREGKDVLAAYAVIPALDWRVIVEVPREEVLAPVLVSAYRNGAVLLAALAVSILVSVVLARRMVRPIRALQEGAAQIGAGNLDQKIEVKTGDELEALADQFNTMAVELKESYAGLERKVEERTGELSESLEYQTAISQVLRVISESPTDVGPVFKTILECTHRLFDSPMTAVLRYDGTTVHLVATHNWSSEALEDARRYYPGPPDPRMMSGRVITGGRVLAIEDTLNDPGYDRTMASLGHWRRMLGAPMIKDGATVGAIIVSWDAPGKTPQRQADLLKTFADQAVIAIENVRLINETREALDQQTAIGDILRVISNSPTDDQPVFDAIADSAARLFVPQSAAVLLVDGNQIRLRARRGADAARDAAARDMFPLPLDRDSIAGETILDARIRYVADGQSDAMHGLTREIARAAGFRSMTMVPLLRESAGIGAISITSPEPDQALSDKQMALLKTFADQAVIAIENVRLFREIEEKNRQLEVASRHKSEFLSNMSHELRTPLNAIIGFSEVLGEHMFGELNEKQDEYVGDIHTSGKHLLSLINDILDLAKVEAGRMELNLSAFNLPAAVDNALTLVRERAMRHGLTLAAAVDPALGDMSADERKVKQILLNLLSNAVKFTPDNGRITVRARAAGDFVEISVVDTGVGIAPDDQAAVFEEFKQVGSDVTKKNEGTGLGLALTRRFVELHGGRIWLESTVGQGSTFTFTLPLVREAALLEENHGQ